MFGFIIVVGSLLLGDVACWTISARWLRRHRARAWARWLCHGFFALQVLYVLALLGTAMLGAIHLRRGFEWIPLSLQALFYIWHLVGLPVSLLMWLGVGLLRLGAAGLARVRQKRAEPANPASFEESTAAVTMSRRDLLLASVAAVPPLLVLGTTGYGLEQTWRFRVHPMTLALPQLPSGLEGFTIAQVSDLHVGRWSTQAFLREVVERTNALKADVVLFTGDLIDISIQDLPRAIETVQGFRSRHGTFLVEGNHDLIEDPSRFRQTMTGAGLNFLWDSAATLDHKGSAVQILGLPWGQNAGRQGRVAPSLGPLSSTLLASRDLRAFPIVLAHHPHRFDAVAQAGLPLVLAGHTHGGQIGLSENATAGHMLFRYVSGLYRQGNSQLVVSNGTGNWFPLRLNAPAEILHITLQRAV